MAEKMGIQEGTRSYISHAPIEGLQAMSLPSLKISEHLHGEFGYIQLFVQTRNQLDQEFPKLKAHLEMSGALWVSWPKKRQLGTDLTLPVVIEVGYSHGLVESTVVSIDNTWSAIKFTHPKVGKTYHNSYGILPEPQKDRDAS